MGSTLLGQHDRTLDMLEDFLEQGKSLHEILWFIYDCQTDYAQLKTLATMAQERNLSKGRIENETH